jgi:hypothetical protein
MPGYVPPALRDRPNYTPKKLSLKPKPVDYTKLKTKQQIFDEYQKKNYGKADAAFCSDDEADEGGSGHDS